jgi:aquaporin Z
MLFCGISWVTMDFYPGSPVARWLPDTSARLAVTGVLFPVAGTLFALSPPGRRSGAHLNPAVTFAFWLQRHVHRHDLFGYVLAQCAGGVTGAMLAWLLYGRRMSRPPVRGAVTHPGGGLAAWATAGVETGMVALLVLVIFSCVSSRRAARWTPFAVWPVITVLVWRVAPYTGTSLNPARTLGSDVAVGWFPAFWAYVVGPLTGAGVAVVLWLLVSRRRTLTAKIFHDPHYRSVMRTDLPAMPADREGRG